jgi:hypothetical protein
MVMKRSQKLSRRLNHKLLYGGAVLAMIVLVLVVLQATHTIHLFQADKTPVRTPEQINQQTIKNNGTGGASSTTKGPAVNNPTPSAHNTAIVGNLITPSGSFVSNHHASISGTHGPNQEQSVCNTSPGAYCDIIFTNGDQSKSLGKKVADESGNSYWNWSIPSIGLTQGSWQISATASASQQTKSSTDSLNLEVGP